MATRILIINRQLVFAVTLKQALEQTGLFDVHPFTTANAAFDFLRDHPQDLALVDYGLPGRSGAKIVQQLRDIQPDIAIIISPKQSEEDVEFLDLQGMIDTPFQARDIIPLIERALNPAAEQEPPSHTRKFSPDSPEVQGQVTTRPLDTSEQPISKQFGTTRLFDGQPSVADEPAQTRNLPEQPTYNEPSQTRNLPASPSYENPPQTRNLPEPPEYENLPQTHMLGEQPEQPDFVPDEEFQQDPYQDGDPEWLKIVGQTRDLTDDPPPPPRPKTRPVQEVPPPHDYGTRSLETPEGERTERQPPARPSAAPEFGPLDEVLKSFGFDSQLMEPPVGEQDTPAVPTKDSDALRQFLATTDPSYAGGDFDNILGAMNPDEIDQSPTPRRSKTAEFEGLIGSLRGDDKHTPLPDRQQQTMDFILTTGMDAVLREIEKTKTGPLPPVPSNLPEEAKPKERKKPRTDTFSRLAAEEPPMPTLEESGTVSDLLVGIQDQSFRNVLSLLRGDEPAPAEELEQDSAPASQAEVDAAFKDFFNPPPIASTQGVDKQDTSPVRAVKPTEPDEEAVPQQSQYNFDYLDDEDTEDGATVAQVVLQTALDETQFPQGFSIDRLMSDIEEQLSAHKLNIRPLPSWDMDTSAFRAVIDQAEIREPSFLPEQLPPGEMIIPDTVPEVREIERKPRSSRGAESWLADLAEPTKTPTPSQAKASTPEPVSDIPAYFQPRPEDSVDLVPPPAENEFAQQDRAAIDDLLDSLAMPIESESEDEAWQGEIAPLETGETPESREPAVRASWIDEPLPAVHDEEAEAPAPSAANASWLENLVPADAQTEQPAEPAEEAAWVDFSDQPAQAETAWQEQEEEETPVQPDIYIGGENDFALYDEPGAPAEEKEESDSEPYVVVSDSLESVIGGADWTPPEGTPAISQMDWEASAEAEPEPLAEEDYYTEQPEEPQPTGSPVAQIDWGSPAPYEEVQPDEWQTEDPYEQASQEAPHWLPDTPTYAEENAPEEATWLHEEAVSEQPAAPVEADWLAEAPANEQPATPVEADWLAEAAYEPPTRTDEIDWQTESPLTTQELVQEEATWEAEHTWDFNSQPAEAELEEQVEPEAQYDEASVAEAEVTEPETEWQPQDSWDLPAQPEEVAPAEAMPETPLSPEEAYLAQLALNLTQVSLELSAEGTILTRNTDIVAFAGHLSQHDALELKSVVGVDWNVSDDGARLRSINLPTSGKDYLLYSIRTSNNLVLSMVFAGTTPLRVIRQQAQRLSGALGSVPEIPVALAQPAVPQPSAITTTKATQPPAILDTYAYVWLLRDPLQRLSDAAIHAINTGLTTQLNELHWNIQNLIVQDDFVYLLAGVPGEVLPHQIISDLQRRSATMAYSQNRDLTPDSLWADSYLVLTPGREMSIEEIQEFINFQRMM